HGGWVDVESQIGKGTSFILHFPVPEKLIEVKPKTIEATSKLQGGQETILVVEDNEPVRKIAVACLRKLGYTILEASNGNTAIQLVQNYRGTIDLLFTDMIMPGNINGLDLYEKLKEKMPGLKVIFTSGHPGDVLQIKADLMASGIFLKKPFDPVALAEKVRNCLNNNQHNGIK
ncbi:MAG: response regulator, partial [Limisphaera sp.]|nr:response regulator [Limisphaera sp.]